MDFQQLLAKMAEMDAPVAEAPEVIDEPASEDTVAECPPDMPAPVATPTTPEPSLSVNMNAQGLNNIADLIKLIAKAEEEAAEIPALPISAPAVPELPAPANLPSLDMDNNEEDDEEGDDEEKKEWANEPDEEVKGTDYMINKLAGGINRPKQMYQHSYKQGDNPMAMEGEELRAWIKSELAQRLAEVKGAK